MARLPKCKNCGEDIFSKDNSFKSSDGWRCSTCYELKEKEKIDRQELYDYICNLYGFSDNIPSGMIMKQIKDYKENFNYKYKGMLLSLKYFYETQDHTVPENIDGVGIIPYVYIKAKKHYIEQQRIAKLCEEAEIIDKNTIIDVKDKSSLEQQKSNLSIIDIDKL